MGMFWAAPAGQFTTATDVLGAGGKHCRHGRPRGARGATYRAGLCHFGVGVLILRSHGHLEGDLYEGPREIGDEDDLAERRLQQRLEVPLTGSWRASGRQQAIAEKL